ncbi:MAG TPA: cation diffusion facilitator family transporter [Thermomicrobiales bacterium]|nr:cation diffusion facilitator family transporter [Thermomicrobiales bacterium]
MAHQHHGHHHGHEHGHSHAPANFGRAFAIGAALNLGFVAAEAVFGLLAGSLALVADAGHNLGDVLGLLLAWGATLLMRRRPTPRRTYGLRRSTILAALANAVILLVAVGAIAWEAILRLLHPAPVAERTVIVVALVGIAVNGVTTLLFMGGRHHDLNIRGAFLHMAADAGVSLGVAVSAAVVLLTGWDWLDPAVSLAIVAVILVGTWGLLRDSLNLALDAVPAEIDTAAVRAYLAGLPRVADVHDLHIWAMSTTETALTAHLVLPDTTPDDALLAHIGDALHERFGIEHATIQVESGDAAFACSCSLLPAPERPEAGARR